MPQGLYQFNDNGSDPSAAESCGNVDERVETVNESRVRAHPSMLRDRAMVVSEHRFVDRQLDIPKRSNGLGRVYLCSLLFYGKRIGGRYRLEVGARPERREGRFVRARFQR
jgi:hypothetical protein